MIDVDHAPFKFYEPRSNAGGELHRKLWWKKYKAQGMKLFRKRVEKRKEISRRSRAARMNRQMVSSYPLRMAAKRVPY